MSLKHISSTTKQFLSTSLIVLLVGILVVAYAVYLPVTTSFAQADAGTLVIADFESGIPTGFVPFADSWDGSGSSTTLAMGTATVDLPTVPNVPGNTVVSVTYDIAASGGWGGGPGYGGVTHDFAAAQDWSGYQAFSLWFYGSNSGADLRVELKSDGANAGTSNRYEYTFTDDTTGWRFFNIPWSAFTRRYDYNPGPSPDDPINLAAMWGYSILLPGGASGSFSLDQVALTAGSVVADFEAGVPAGFVPFADSWDGSGSSTTLAMDTATVDLPTVPNVPGNAVIAVTYDIAASGGWGGGPGYGGVTHDFAATQDWSGYQAFSLWFYGSNSGADLRVELKSDGADAANSNRYEYTFTDDTTGWRFFNIPWGDFIPRIDYNPGPNPAAPINLAAMWGYSILLPGGASGSFYLDQVALSGVPLSSEPGIVIDDFESGLPSGFDGNGIPIGFFTAQGAGSSVGMSTSQTPPAPELPDLGTPNNVLQADFDVTSWAVLIHGFENEAVDTWVSQDWSAYEGFAFWLYGNNSGTEMFVDILENRNPDSTVDDAERWTVTFTDDFEGWQLQQFPFTDFVRKNVSNGAPDDGFTLDEVHGWAFGTLGTGGPQIYYLDQVSLYGVAPERPLEVTFSASEYKTVEGTTAQIEVKLTRPLKEGDPDQVSVEYSTDLGSAIVDRDYTPTAGTLTFEQGGFSKLTFPVETFDNAKHDGDKTVLLRLSDPVDVPLGYVVQSRLTILDDDPFDPLLIDDFERTPDLFEAYGGVSISRLEIPSGDPLELPDQGAYEGVLNVVAPLAVAIDIMPGSDASSICNSGTGVVPVAILTTATFDALTVDHTTVSLGDAYEAHVDKKTGEARRHVEDVDGDGDMDLVFHFVYAETGLGCDPAEAVLNGSTFAGQPITAGGDSGLYRDFPIGESWSAYDGLNFWYYGTGSGDTVALQLKDNRAPDPGPSGWNLVWSDEFDDPAGTAPNSANWTHEIGDGTINGNPGWGNSELQYYTDSTENSATDGDGNLVITAMEADGSLLCYYGPCEYTSARLISQYKAEFAYGRIESRLRVPEGAGLWPAFWTLGTDIGEVGWPQSGEIDIMEFVGRAPYEIFGTIHGPGYSGGQSIGGTYTFDEQVSNNFHTFAIEWQPDLIKWYVDDILYHEAAPADVLPNEWVFNHPFFIILNVAVGGNFGGPVGPDTTFPQDLTVDYVRVYQGPDTAERWAASFVDDFTGWQPVSIPFASFSRSAEQPAGAPDDGLNLTEVWGYGFEFLGGTSTGSVLLDQVRLPAPPVVSGIIIDDFEAGLPTDWFQYGDYDSGTIITTETIAGADRPGGEPSNSVLSIDYVSEGWGAGTGRDLLPPHDWSAYDGLSFWFKGTNTGTTFELILSDNKSDPNVDTAERFHATFRDDFDGWQHISLPWSVFYRGAWQPPGAPDDGLTLTEMWAYAIALPVGTSGNFYMDDVALYKEQTVEDFEAGLPATWFQYGDYGSGTSITTETIVVADRPGGVPDTTVLSIDYVSAGWGAGTGQDLNPPQDWSFANGLSFWYYGNDTGTTFELILSDNKSDPNADTAERFHATFSDDFDGWQHISLPWSVFYRGAWQPEGAPDDGLTLTEMWAYAIALPVGTSGNFYLDDVALVR